MARLGRAQTAKMYIPSGSGWRVYLVVVSLVSAYILLLLAGCSLPGTFAHLDKEQIEALAKIKDAAATCVTATAGGMYKGIGVFTSIDRGVYGKITIKDDCSVTVETIQPVKPTP